MTTSSPSLVLPHYTYEDYAKWEGRWELLKGTAIMSPSPNDYHQYIASNLMYALKTALKKTRYTVFYELDCIISDDITLRPDIAVYQNFSGKSRKYPTGANPPLVVIEVLSPSNKDHDIVNKHIEYRAAGVRCYLIVDPEKETIEVAYGDAKTEWPNIVRFGEFIDHLTVCFDELF